MWADRLLDAKALGYSKWEASDDGTWKAVDMIPKDIILCDWHYEKQAAYPSVKFLAQKGFRVWPSSWKSLEAAKDLSEYSLAQNNRRVMGMLCTTWDSVKIKDLAEWPPLKDAMAEWTVAKTDASAKASGPAQ
jgi:hypothetical protein